MFFVLSKILNFITQPTTWLIAMFIGYLLFRKDKWRKRCLYVGLSGLLFFTNPFFSNIIFSWWEVEPTSLEMLEKHDIAVVFSGITIHDKKPHDRIYFNKAADRITMAIQLYKTGKVDKILISGGYGSVLKNTQREAETLTDFLVMLGIPKSDIIQEKNANNTYENAVFTKEIIDEKYPNAKLLLITSAFHMRRSLGCARKAGLVVTPFAVDYKARYDLVNPEHLIIPQSYALYNWDVLVHEIIGYWVYVFSGKIKL